MSSQDADPLPYRACVGVVLINRDKLVWIGRRIPKWEGDGGDQLWQMPQGGIDKGESPEQAALRELREETGTQRATVLEHTRGWLTYDLPPEAIGAALKGRFRGQKQKWFAMRFEGSDDDFDIADGHGEDLEFDAWRWEKLDQLPGLVVPFKRHVYEQVVAAFSHLTA
jgi:putative (di)nucleoside polyphosphate hydrolase